MQANEQVEESPGSRDGSDLGGTDANGEMLSQAPAAVRKRKRQALMIWFSFCLALVLLVALNMK